MRRAVLAMVLAWGGPRAAWAEESIDPSRLEEAKAHMAAGSAFYNDPSGVHKCEEAITEFEKAFELSGSWKALRAQAICELELEQDGAAIAHFEEVLKRGGAQIAPNDKNQIELDLKALSSAVATVRLNANQPDAKLTATRQSATGKQITNRYVFQGSGLIVGIHPGQYVFRASAGPNFEELTFEVEIQNGSELNRTLEFIPVKVEAPPPPPPVEPAVVMERPVPVLVWIFAGVTGATAITSGTFMGLAKVAGDDFAEQNGHGSTEDLEALRSDVVTKNIVADVFLGATVASLGTTLVLYFLRPEVAVTQEVAVLPMVGLRDGAIEATVTVGGSF